VGVVKRVFGWSVTVLLLASFTVSGAISKPLIHPTIYVKASEPVKIEEIALIPVSVIYVPKIGSGFVTFITNTSSVKAEKVTLDPNSRNFPYTVYVPVTVTREGLFDIKGNITVEAPNGEKFWNGESSLSVQSSSLGIFAFEGEVFFGGSSSLAVRNKAYHDLQKTSLEYNKLLNKKDSIGKETLKQNFSEEENEELNKLRDDVVNNLRKKYFDRYPIKTEPTSP
jgi:hypothetical protein